MQTILIVEPSETITAQLHEQLQDAFKLTFCQDGEAAADLLKTLQPDILILNLMIAHTDGLTLLQEATYKPPIILATTTFVPAHVINRAQELGVSMMLVAPTARTICLRLADLLEHGLTVESHPNRREQLHHILHSLHFSPHLNGYSALCEAVLTYMEDPNQQLSSEIFPKVAKTCNCLSIAALDKALRRVISAAWQQRDARVWTQYFYNEHKCPSVLRFLSRIAQELD